MEHKLCKQQSTTSKSSSIIYDSYLPPNSRRWQTSPNFSARTTTDSIPSLQQLANLPVKERHQHLKAAIAATANDFSTDPELTEFSVLDGED
jgi:hypothetical protein